MVFSVVLAGMWIVVFSGVFVWAVAPRPVQRSRLECGLWIVVFSGVLVGMWIVDCGFFWGLGWNVVCGFFWGLGLGWGSKTVS